MNSLVKIKAFTLLETIIGIVLLGIIAGITLTSITGFNSNLFNFHRKSQEVNKIIEIRELLKYEFSSSSEITRTNDGFIIKIQNQEIHYQIRDHKIQRNLNQSITHFDIPIESFITSFQGNIELIPGNTVDQIEITLDLKQPFVLNLKKDKTLADIINDKYFVNEE